MLRMTAGLATAAVTALVPSSTPVPWFEHVAWDIGLAALAPGRRRLAVLAATDTARHRSALGWG
ncbi:DUF6183 family protein [Streptomyces sp. NPDC096033]|uniref:DUF6183 family protein n=1 Tax=Streptomyces sp. NPDC096033 TaxID=3366071 RepID=UPI0038197EBE